MNIDIRVILSLAIFLGALIGTVIVIVKDAKNGNFQILLKIAYRLVVEAERMYGGGTGDIKYTYVTEKILSLLPESTKQYFTSKDIDNAIEQSVKKLKEVLAEQAKRDS